MCCKRAKGAEENENAFHRPLSNKALSPVQGGQNLGQNFLNNLILAGLYIAFGNG